MRILDFERWIAPLDPRGVARDASGRALARASYLLLLASSGALVATQRGEGWLALGTAIACAAGMLDLAKRGRPSLAALGFLTGAAVSALWALEIWELANSSLQMNELLGTVAETVWIGGALLALLDKSWTHFCALVLCALVVGFLGLAGAESAAILWALLAIAWSLLLVMQRAQRWRSAALLGREEGRGIGLDHGARRGALPAIAQGFLASWLLCVAAMLAVFCYLVLPTSILRARGSETRDPSRAEWGRLAGFSEGLSLGSLGDLKQNFEPALIVRPPEPDGGELMRALARRTPYWRGLAHARFDAAEQRWQAEDPLAVAPCAPIDSAPRGERLRQAAPVLPRAQWASGSAALAYEQELLLGESRVVFALDVVHSVDLELRYPRQRSLEGSLRRDGEGVLWCVDESGRGVLREGSLLLARARASPRDRRSLRVLAHADPRYSTVDASLERDPRFAKAAQRFGDALRDAEALSGGRTIGAIEKAIESALHARCRYSLHLLGGARNPADPLLLFLEGADAQRQGHCVFFSTAAALVLRKHAVATRLVTEFAGGIQRDGCWIVAAAHAHAWIEVWCGDEKQWIAVDPTPPAHRPEGEARDLLAQRAAARIDAAADERAYEASRGDGGPPLLTAARRFVEDFSASDPAVRARAEDRLRAAAAEWSRDLASGAAQIWPVLLLCAGAGVSGMLALRFARREKPHRDRARRGLSAAALAGARLYDRCLALVARTGIVRVPSETPREFESRAAEQTSEAIAELLAVQTRLFERTRYGELELSAREQREGELRLGELERLVRDRRRSR